MSIPLLPTQSVTGAELSIMAAAYLVGCLTFGYYWARWRTGLDIRQQGSGNVGARNVGRLLGRTGFFITLLFDALKGVAVVSIATQLDVRPEVVIAAMIAVVAGHSWPAQLRFRGGKGVATSLGAVLAFEPFMTGVLLLLFLPLWAVMRSFTLAGLVAFALLPLAVFGCGLGNHAVAAASFLAILMAVTHRRNIREEIAGLLPDRQLKESAMHRPKGRRS